MRPEAGHRQAVDRRHAIGMALADHIHAAHRGHVAVGLVAGQLHAPALAQRRGIGAGPDLGVVLVLRRGEIGQRDGVAELPEVVVAQRNHRAQVTGVGAVVVVQADAGVPGILVFHLQVDVHGAGPLALAHHRQHLAAGGAVDLRQLALDLGEVGHLALLQGRHFLAQLHRRIVLGADHPDATDSGLGDLQVDHPAAHLLLRQLDVDRLVALLLVGGLQRIARPLDVAQAALRSEEGIHRRLDGAVVQHGVAAYHVLVDVHQTLGLGSRRGGRGLVGQRSARQCDSQATDRPALAKRVRTIEQRTLHTVPRSSIGTYCSNATSPFIEQFCERQQTSGDA
ncbi:hypothetical protein PAERUG_E5_London_17_VIM_2_12_12_05237 [Pseudomonas aeruginosa]|nr:hypothetical protein PAERUG_E5_London_17_VIM_2_12_12_05237 [Pseudomonas aeruginosa]